MHGSFNVVIFGEAGVGKSSVINLIAGQKVSETSADSWGCTLESSQYTFQVARRTFNTWSTIGLREPISSVAGYQEAKEKMYSLIQQTTAEGGLDLLLFCMTGSGSRVSQTMLSNYRLFFEVLYEKKVPIALVVTHLEPEVKMEDWWVRNVHYLNHCGLKFSGHACVTGLPGHEKSGEAHSALEHLLLGYDEGRYSVPPTSERHSGILDQFIANFTSRTKTVKNKQKRSERVLRTRSVMIARQHAKSPTHLAAFACDPPPSTRDHKPEVRTSMCPSFNIILFGEAGVGKSSVINLIADENVADTSPDACGCTLKSKQYTFEMAKRTLNVWDTIGLGEPAFSASNCLGAIAETYALIKQLETQGGLDLLLFCIPGSRVTATMQSNYRLFFEVLCGEQIPIAAVVTRLEDEERMEDWWARNEKHLGEGGLKFGGHACITGKRGHPKAEESLSALKSLLLGYDNKERYPMPPASNWFSSFLKRLPRIPRLKESKDKHKELEQVLIKRCNMDPSDTRKLTKTITYPDAQN